MFTVLPNGGLCNKLRVLLSYYEFAKKQEKILHIKWVVSKYCNGNFLDYFETIPEIQFINNLSSDNIIKYRGCYIRPNFKPNYEYLVLLNHMKEKIQNKINILGNNYIAIHIRRTDHITLQKNKGVYRSHTDEKFIDWIDKNKNNVNLYVATDNQETYNTFKEKYPQIIKFNYHTKENKDDFRETSLENAIIDLYMCVYAKNFKGTCKSSFTETILEIKKKKTWIPTFL